MPIQTNTVAEVADKTFDFVIIGGGNAGCVLARRLSDVPNFTVLLIEAGRAHGDDPRILRPDGWPAQFLDHEFDWAFNTVPQKHVSDTVCPWSRGKGLGGSSAMNLTVWVRPAREEIDALARLGNPGWNWDTFAKYCRKVERYCTTEPEYATEFRNLLDLKSVGHEGPIPVSFGRTSSNADYPYQKATENNDIPINSNYLSGDIHGTFKCMSSVDPTDGSRVSAAAGYLYPVLGRPNLKVLTEAHANRIITRKDGGHLVARGVEFQHNGKVYSAWAKNEVLLCAGALKSPQLLELSGIGDPSVLEPLGIPVELVLPAVGTNVQDHLATGIVHRMVDDKGIVTHSMLQDTNVEARFRQTYPNLPHPWQLTLQSVSFISLQAANQARARDIVEARRKEIDAKAALYPPGLLEQYKLELEYLANEKIPELEIMPYISVGYQLTHPFARGTIHVGSADPAEQPIIDPQYLNNDTDLEVLVEGFKFTRKVCQTDPFKSLCVEEVLPGPAVQTDEQIRALLRKGVRTTWHTCGSCSMLPRDKGGVVDPTLKVYGTKNVRVVDLSILPLEVAANTQSVVYGIAEQAADIIKSAYDVPV